MTTPPKSVVAAFDFDGTLTRRDTFMAFLLHTAGPLQFSRHLTALLPTLAAYGAGLLRNDVAKERVLTRFLTGMPLNQLQQQGEQFATRKLPRLLRPEAMARLDWHQTQGHRCLVVSASLELYLTPWAKQRGALDVIGSRLEVAEDGSVTGKLQGANCHGEEKVRRLQQLLGPRDTYTLYAYGDSPGDRPLLAYADRGFYRTMS